MNSKDGSNRDSNILLKAYHSFIFYRMPQKETGTRKATLPVHIGLKERLLVWLLCPLHSWISYRGAVCHHARYGSQSFTYEYLNTAKI